MFDMIWARWFPPEASNYAGVVRQCNGPAGLGEINDEELDRLDEEVRKEEKNILSGLSDATMDAIESVDWGELGRDTGKVLVSTLQMTLDTALAASSIGLILLGLTGSALGGAVTCTGVGAAVGVPAAAVSVTAVTAGVSGLAISVSKTAGDCVKFSENLGDMAGKSYTKPKFQNTTNLPNQGTVKGNVEGAPPVDAGKQGKHVIGHNNFKVNGTPWPEGQNGVDLTQEAWMKGREINGTNGLKREYDFNRIIGSNGETKVRVHMDTKGNIHGHPVG